MDEEPMGRSARDTEVFLHGEWTRILERFVDEHGRVDYLALSRERDAFDRYVEEIETVGPENCPERFPTPRHELAHYLNAYNALVVQGVLERGPETRSVWRGLVPGLRFFVLRRIRVGGKTLSLKALEDGIIRERYRDPRIHAALNCASLGCPPLSRQAFEGATLDAQLDLLMRRFVNAPQACQVDSEARTVTVSRIFKWYRSDFLEHEARSGRRDPHLFDYLDRYRSETLPRTFELRFADYDRGLNQR